MKKNNTVVQRVTKPNQRSANKSVDESPGKKARKEAKEAPGTLTIGIDLGDKTSRYCVLNGSG